MIVCLGITLDKDAGLLGCQAQGVLVRFFAGLLEPRLRDVIRQIAARHLDSLDMGIAVPFGIGRRCCYEYGHHGQCSEFLKNHTIASFLIAQVTACVAAVHSFYSLL